MTASEPDHTLKLVSTAYGVAIQPERFDELLEAWDVWCDSLIETAESAFADVSPVFDEALGAADHLQRQTQTSPLEHSPVPTVLLDDEKQVVAMNAAAQALFGPASLASAADFKAEPEQARGAHRMFRLPIGDVSRQFLAVESQVGPLLQAEHPSAEVAVFLSLMDWNSGFEAELADRLDLSSAELRVARLLLEGRTAQEISGDLGRSLPTIRSHIKALLSKTGARRQSELVQFLTIMRQVSETRPAAPSAVETADFEQIELTGQAGRLRVTRYGTGQPLLYFTTSSCPHETEAVRAALSAEGFAVIAPTRPGFRGSDVVDGCASESVLEHWLDQLVALAGPRAAFVGHREGGVLAAKAAARVLAQGGNVAGLGLISTGAPLRSLDPLNEAPPSIRRSFLAAHFAIPAMRLGYQTAARLFRSGALGRDQITRFFHKDSPADKLLIEDPYYYDLTQEFLEFCFDNPVQIVRDIEDWTSDWSDSLEAVAHAAPVVFVHGTAHSFHSVDRIEALVETDDRLALCALEQSGQLAIYERPEAVAKALAIHL